MLQILPAMLCEECKLCPTQKSLNNMVAGDLRREIHVQWVAMMAVLCSPALLTLSGGVPSSMALAESGLTSCCSGRDQVAGGSCCLTPCNTRAPS